MMHTTIDWFCCIINFLLLSMSLLSKAVFWRKRWPKFEWWNGSQRLPKHGFTKYKCPGKCHLIMRLKRSPISPAPTWVKRYIIYRKMCNKLAWIRWGLKSRIESSGQPQNVTTQAVFVQQFHLGKLEPFASNRQKCVVSTRITKFNFYNRHYPIILN